MLQSFYRFLNAMGALKICGVTLLGVDKVNLTTKQ